MIHYLDTSAALKLVVDEDESTALAHHLNRVVKRGDELVASMLLFTEMHCAAGRRGAISADSVNTVLESVALVNLERDDLLRAGTSSWGLRSAAAIHLAVALRLEVDTLIAYDAELLRRATDVGLTTESPRGR